MSTETTIRRAAQRRFRRVGQGASRWSARRGFEPEDFWVTPAPIQPPIVNLLCQGACGLDGEEREGLHRGVARRSSPHAALAGGGRVDRQMRTKMARLRSDLFAATNLRMHSPDNRHRPTVTARGTGENQGQRKQHQVPRTAVADMTVPQLQMRVHCLDKNRSNDARCPTQWRATSSTGSRPPRQPSRPAGCDSWTTTINARHRG